VCTNLKKEDHIFNTHRCHGHYIAKGGDLKLLMANYTEREPDAQIRDLCATFNAGKIPNPMDDIRYYNIKTMLAKQLK